NLTSKLLAFSRKQTLRTETLNVADVIRDFTPFLHRTLTEKVRLKIEHGRATPSIKADRNQLEVVIMNLAVNARDAMPEDGRLTIRTRNMAARDIARLAEKEISPGDYVLCEVSDTGSGMDESVRAKIFDPFFSTKDVGKGTGLGLSTVYGIIKQTEGYIFCDSTPGAGTTFRIYLPRHDEHEVAAPVAPKADAKSAAGGGDMTGSGVVLLVEDEEHVRRLAARALARQGFEVLQAGSGVEALEVLEACDATIDLVVSDIVMPEMDGPTLLKALRARHPELKIIFISGYAEDALQTLNPDEEFAFLPKPFQLADLVAKVKATIS
ncbi:MAG: response regulator, partial [Pseudomonadota bacterium]